MLAALQWAANGNSNCIARLQRRAKMKARTENTKIQKHYIQIRVPPFIVVSS